MISVLHITPHLGGGVGKALSELIHQARTTKCHVRHVIACLEEPRTRQFFNQILADGSDVIVAPNVTRISELLSEADVVQLEWWNHPATIECLCRMPPRPIQLLVWCHVSGLNDPIIPQRLIEASNRFIFTSPCSLEANEVTAAAVQSGDTIDVISSGSGLSSLPAPHDEGCADLSMGYMGSLNFSKLHPDYVNFLSAVRIPNFKVRLIGEPLNREILERKCLEAGRPNMLEFRGYVTNVAEELRAINVLVYLLNPVHYGTAENALLEAMSMGVVPVVLDNPPERNIVEHYRTGLIVNSVTEFADAIEWLRSNPHERSRMGTQAAAAVRSKFTAERMETSLRSHYEAMMSEEKRQVMFEDIFGSTPDEWFLACQRNPEMYGEDGEIHWKVGSPTCYNRLEKSKGSVFHFLEYFPQVGRLRAWATRMEASQCS